MELSYPSSVLTAARTTATASLVENTTRRRHRCGRRTPHVNSVSLLQIFFFFFGYHPKPAVAIAAHAVPQHCRTQSNTPQNVNVQNYTKVTKTQSTQTKAPPNAPRPLLYRATTGTVSAAAIDVRTLKQITNILPPTGAWPFMVGYFTDQGSNLCSDQLCTRFVVTGALYAQIYIPPRRLIRASARYTKPTMAINKGRYTNASTLSSAKTHLFIVSRKCFPIRLSTAPLLPANRDALLHSCRKTRVDSLCRY